MTIRSKLFATVAMPLLTMTIGLQPALADAQFKPFQVAQADPDEILKKRQAREQQDGAEPEGRRPARGEGGDRRQQREQTEESEPAPERQAKPAANDGGDAPRPSREERRKQREAEQQQNAEPQAAPADGDAPRPSREERRRQREAEQQQNGEQATPPAAAAQTDGDAAQPSDAERKRIREERRKQREAQQQNGDAAAPGAAPAEDAAQPSDAERKRIREERRKQREAQQQNGDAAAPGAAPAEDAAQPSDADRKRIREERRKQREAEQQQSGDQPADQAGEQADPANGDAARPSREERRRQREADRQQNGAQPDAAASEDAGNDAASEAGDEARPRNRPARDVIDKRSRAEREQLARDPSKSDDTVVLPVDNGAAVLDSDKDADNRGNDDTRERRRREREQVRQDRDNQPAPRTDADAQSDHRERRPGRDELNAAITEEGRRVDRVPEFNAGDLVDALTGRRPRVEETRNNRTVLDFGDEIVVRSDDRPRLRRDARDSYYEELPRGRTREVIERPNGMRVVTIYNRYGDVIQRTRINSDGEEYLMVYAPEADEDNRPPLYDAGEDLPPMRLTVPVRDYIIDTSTEPDRDYYDFLAEPPVERVERTYSLDEVRNSARIRDKVRRIDLDTITFATGSAEVPMSQAKTLRKVADAMLEVIDKDPGETFLIEGHTDAVGSDQSNLVLSDERAESVASLLTDVYQIPPENLVTQGYGERFLKVRTTEAEQENRRVTIRRVTPLVRPVAQK